MICGQLHVECRHPSSLGSSAGKVPIRLLTDLGWASAIGRTSAIFVCLCNEIWVSSADPTLLDEVTHEDGNQPEQTKLYPEHGEHDADSLPSRLLGVRRVFRE